MTPIRTLIRLLPLAALLALGATPVHAAVECTGACHDLVEKARALDGQGKYQEALNTYKAAEQADRQASQPVSMAAALMLRLSAGMKPEQARPVREMAQAGARYALKLAPSDPLALETLRLIEDAPTPLHTPTPEAARLFSEGEAEYAQRHFKEALQKYEAAAQADPQYSVAWVDAGDCYYVQKDYAQAETRFRRATGIEPRNAQAWRFLSDALRAQGRDADAEAALLSGIAADPSQQPDWNKLASLRAKAGTPLKPLGLRRGVYVVTNPDGKFTVQLDSLADHHTATPDGALRLALGVSEVKMRSDDKASGKARSPYAIELAAWRTALEAIDEAQAKGGEGLTEPALLQMQAFARDGQLEPALLLLTFRQAYRPELEAWEAAHPGGIKAFIDRYGLRP
jgi:tetratricopeptide (TPR) repeat protein